MLQELNINDINNVSYNLKKTDLLTVYNYLKNRINANGENPFKDMYFDDNFSWGMYKASKAQIKGFNVYKVYYFPVKVNEEEYSYATGFRIKHLSELKEHIVKEFLKDNATLKWNNSKVENYLNIIFDKLRPTQELVELLDEEITNWLKELKKKETIKFYEEKEPILKVINNAYIYGIYIDGNLEYIGKTSRGIKERISEHIECTLNSNIKNSQQNYLYQAMRECKGYKFKMLYESHNQDTEYQLERLEKDMIEEMKPKYNYQGVKVNYQFSKQANDAMTKDIKELNKMIKENKLSKEDAWELLSKELKLK